MSSPKVHRINARLGASAVVCSGTDKEMRDQIHQEIERKSKTCSNPTYNCSIPRIDGYELCIRHILRDPRSNYRQCTFIYPNGKKCTSAVEKHDTKSDPSLTTFCFQHSRQMQLQKTHAVVGRFPRIETNEMFLQNVVHHLNVESTEKSDNGARDDEIDVVSPHVSPFIPHSHINDLVTVANSMRKRRRVLDYASDSSSADEAPCIASTSRGHEDNASNYESTNSEDEDVLKHAGVYTLQEGVRMSGTKLIRLQQLYIDQVDRLHHLLKERRRRYLHAIRKEREVLCNIHDQPKETRRERLLYDQLKALNTYHRRHGVEAVLMKKHREKRMRSSENYAQRGPGFAKCAYIEGGVKCTERTLPSCKFCRKHILEDKKQTLFRACGVDKGGMICEEPIPSIFDDSTCILHLAMPNRRLYLQKKYESENEEEEFQIKKEFETELITIPQLPKVETLDIEPKIEAETEMIATEMLTADAENCNVTIAHESKPIKLED